MKFDEDRYIITDNGNVGKITLVLFILGLVSSVAGYMFDSKQFFHSYLVSFMFWTSISLGGLFMVMIHYLTGATWSVVVRRLFENIMIVLPFMAVFAVPILFGIDELYHWSHHDTVQSDQLLQGKSAYLNIPFFIIRMIGYFVIWFILSRLLFKVSLSQDEGRQESHTKRMRLISAPGMILFAVTVTFAAFDWLMSLDAHWYSTIFGVYVFAGCVLAALCFLALLITCLKRNNILINEITFEHYHDIGKLIFAFIIFWAYMAFSQYFLIWYGNIPEETVWFLHRWNGSWKNITLLIVFGHFIIPFFLLFPQGIKRNPVLLSIMAVWILIMHWVDLFWLVMPSFQHHGFHISWIDLTTMIGIGGAYIWLFMRYLVKQPLIPVKDPRLEESIKFIS